MKQLMAVITIVILFAPVALSQIASSSLGPSAYDLSAMHPSAVEPAPIAIIKPNSKAHNFWDRQQKIAFAVTATIRVADIAQTCYALAQPPRIHQDGLVHSFVESWAPTQSCAGVAAWVGAGQATQTLTQWLLHRKGLHRLERITPAVMVGPNVAGIVATFRARRRVDGR